MAQVRCARCGRFISNDGSVLCALHGSANPGFKQDTLVAPGTLHGGREAFQEPTEHKIRATSPSKKGKKRGVVAKDETQLARDRNRVERRVKVEDHDADWTTQQWYRTDTGRRTGGKKGRLTDAAQHGPRSKKRFKETGE